MKKRPCRDERPQLDRREFLALASGAVGIALTESPLLLAEEFGQELPTHRFRVRRDADLMSLELSFVNFERRGDILKSLGAGRSLVIVRFPPQNLAEARFDKVAGTAEEPKPGDKPKRDEPTQDGWEEQPLLPPPALPLPPTPLPADAEKSRAYSPVAPVASFLSGPSWIVFSVPDLTVIPLSLEAAQRHAGMCGGVPPGSRSVIDVWMHQMGAWPIRVPENAVTPGRVGMPAGDETCLEIPFRLFIAPKTITAKWITSSTPPLRFEGPKPGAVELWHAALHDRTRLIPATPPADMPNLPPELAPPKRVTLQARAVFSPDYRAVGKPPWNQFYPGKLPLSHRALVRHALVKQMMEGQGDGWIDAEHLLLSSLGADASLSYVMQTTFREIHDRQIEEKTTSNEYNHLAIWKHRMVVGRDVFLLSAWTGFLFPFVYPSLLVELTRRSFVSRKHAEGGPTTFGPPGAYLLTEYFILVQDPVKQYSGSDNVLGRKMPIKKATLLETRSPLIQVPSGDEIDKGFVPKLLAGGGPVRWPIEFEDESGRRSKTTDAGLLFATNVVEGHKRWNSTTDAEVQSIRRWSLPAQRIGLAPDKAQLIGKEGGPSAAVRHTLKDDERAPAGDLARELQTALAANPTIADQVRQQLANLGQTISGLPDAAQNAARRLSAETRREVGKLTEQIAIGQAAAEAEDIVEGVLRQLSRAEQAATDVEVHAIEFASRRVNQVLEKINNKEIPDALRAAASEAEFLQRFDAMIKDEVERKGVKAELTTLWNQLPSDWQKRRDEALRFFSEFQKESELAKAFFRHGFQPQLFAADVIVPALKAMGGTKGPQELKLVEDYAVKGIDRIQNSVFAQFTKAIDDGKAMADRIQCAVASPAAQVAGLSRDLGALVGDGAEAIKQLSQKEEFNLSGAIPDFKLLGVLPLSRIVTDKLTGGQLPSINVITLPDHVEQIWEWNAELKPVDLGLLEFIPAPPPKRPENVHLYVKMTTRIDVPDPNQAASGTSPRGRVRLEGLVSYWNRAAKKPILLSENDGNYSFSLKLLKLIDIKFIDLSFEADYEVGQNPKPKVKPRLGIVEFLPPLDFIKKLQELLPFLGKGFDVVQAPGRIGISYEFQLPAVAFGVFSLRNLAIGSAVLLSFEGKPLRFDFNFSSWKEPFELTVMCFGGRGFLKIGADTSGYRDLQGMIEFGGALSFNVVVASGGLYVMAGIYFRITPEVTTVAGFLRAGGCLSVLGLINASVEFLLMVSYVRMQDGSSKLAGEASVTVSIDLFLVSFDVQVTMYKEFAGSGGGQTALADPRSPFRRVSRGRSLAAPPSSIPVAYFDRTRPAAQATVNVPGRFENLAKWDREYWSQFAF